MYQFGTILFLVFVISYHFHASHNFHEMHLTGIIKRFRILQILIAMQFGDTQQTCSTFQLKNKQIQVENEGFYAAVLLQRCGMFALPMCFFHIDMIIMHMFI